jgi:Tfp pilus assembly protein PilN
MSSEYPQNPLPTIFAEQLSPPHEARERSSAGGLVISRGTIAVISLLLIGMLIAGTFIFYSRWKSADANEAALNAKLTAAVAENAKLRDQNAQYDEHLDKYRTIERLLNTAKADTAKIQTLLVAKPNFPAKKLMKLDEPLWREKVETDLATHVSKLEQQYTDIANWSSGPKVVVVDRTAPPGAIRAKP